MPIFLLWISFGGLLIWNLALIFAPLLGSSANRFAQIVGGVIYFFMDPVCHQLPERSLFIANLPMPVCARCFSIYLAAFFTVAVPLLGRRLRHWPGLVYAGMALLVGLEIGAEKLDLIHNWFELRLFSGFILGILLARLFIEGIFSEFRKGIDG